MSKIDKIKLAWYSSYKLNKLREAVKGIIPSRKTANVVFIFGCQRSGTTIIQKLISLHPGVKYHGEGDAPYFYSASNEKHHRIKPPAETTACLQQESIGVIAIKPLYESHLAAELIAHYPGSKGIWVFRHYLDVIDSHIHYYNQDAINYISPLFSTKKDSWLNEYITDEARDLIAQFSLDKLSGADAYGLFWVARNSLYWHVKDGENILPVCYESLVKSPSEQISTVCKFLDLPFRKFYSRAIRSGAVSKQVDFTLHPAIEHACKDIYARLSEECQ